MSIVIKTENFYFGFWTAVLSGHKGDVLGCLWREASDGTLYLKYRFRYFVDTKVFDSDDPKSWYLITSCTDQSDAKALKMRDDFTEVMRIGYESGHLSSVSYVAVNGNGDAMAKACADPERPYLHCLEVSAEEFDQMMARKDITR